MTTEPEYLTGNAKSLENLRALLGRLSDSDLQHDLGEGWTVAAMLGHLAFYDFRVSALADHWRRAGSVTASPLDADVLNVAMLPVWLAVPPRRAVELALQAAEAANAGVAGLEAATLAGMQSVGNPLKLDRAEHRQEHIDQIERALAG
ncbi:MAG: hypothetical protein ABI847_13895 [Anaerolineales bacterium]